MQGRHRNPNDGGKGYNDGRGYNSNYRNYNRSGSGNFSRKPYLPPPPRRKEEILLEAGRLAAEYLVYKGLLPASSLPPKWQNGKYQGFKGQDRDPPVSDGPTSALNRLGNLNSDQGSGRRRYGDDYNDRMGSRNQFRVKKRMNPYSRENGLDWGRESSGRWMGRNRGYNDMEDEDDFAPGYHRDRRSGFNHLPSRSENTGESGSENHDITEDTGSKASSSSTRRDPPSEVDGDLSKAMVDDGKTINLEAGDEVKSDASGDSKKKNQGEESDAQPCETEGDSNSGDDLMKLCSFARVPTRPRSSAAQRSPKADQGVTAEASNTGEGSSGEPKVASGEDISGGSLNTLPTDQTDTKSQAPEVLSITSVQPGVEPIDQQQEVSQSPPGFGSLKLTIDEAEDAKKGEGMKRQRDSSPDDKLYRMHNVRAKQSSPEVENPPVDEQKVALVTVPVELPMDEAMVAPVTIDQEPLGDALISKVEVAIDQEQPLGDALISKVEVAIDQEQPLSDALILKVEPELDDMLEEEKQLLPTSFKTFDLNLMQAPEITEIPDDPDPEQHNSSAPRLETGKELSMDFGLSIGNNSNGADDFSRISGDDKVVQVIDLEDDSNVDGGAFDPSSHKDEPIPIYSNLDNFLDQPEHADLPGIQDSYSLAISEFLGSDISRCPSVPSDLNNLQSGMGLHDTEGVPNDDDSIYVSLGEIPIGFMEVWDQPPQVYGKFF